MGLNVSAVQNPLTSIADDVAATHRIINAQNGPVLLAGHSYGGCYHGSRQQSMHAMSAV